MSGGKFTRDRLVQARTFSPGFDTPVEIESPDPGRVIASRVKFWSELSRREKLQRALEYRLRTLDPFLSAYRIHVRLEDVRHYLKAYNDVVAI